MQQGLFRAKYFSGFELALTSGFPEQRKAVFLLHIGEHPDCPGTDILLTALSRIPEQIFERSAVGIFLINRLRMVVGGEQVNFLGICHEVEIQPVLFLCTKHLGVHVFSHRYFLLENNLKIYSNSVGLVSVFDCIYHSD